ncbi:MAG: alcohol dehydrogenase catalytic domain-containing protein [Halieaceae bacterium]
MNMKAIVFEGSDKPLALRELAVPVPGPGQLLLKVSACGICGSDLHAYKTSLTEENIVFGHEFSGSVEAIGDGAIGDWKVGDRVIALGAMLCGQCPACERGQPEQCEKLESIGFTRDGAYAEYVLTHSALTIKIPEDIDDRQAALVEPLAVGLTAIKDCKLPMGGNVLVIGAGIIGIAVAKWARFFGAENIGISDLENSRLERAKAVGATMTINAKENPDPVQAFLEATGQTPDAIVECVGRPMLKGLVEMAPAGAHIVVLGASMQEEPISSLAAAQKKVRMTFSFGYELPDFDFIVRMISAGRVSTDKLITQSVGLDETPQVFAELMKPNDHCKVLIEPGIDF